MTPNLSAELYQQGVLTKDEALWVYNKDGKAVPNSFALFDDDGNPKF